MAEPRNDAVMSTVNETTTARTRDWDVRTPLVAFTAVFVLLLIWNWASRRYFGDTQPYEQAWLEGRHFTGDWLVRNWAHWDSEWYDTIARDGYWYDTTHQSPVAFFPVYPLLMRAVGAVVSDVLLAGFLITIAAGAAASVLFYNWCRALLGDSVARVALALLLVFPYAWYLFGAVYSDALFLVLALGAFMLVERNHLIAATLVGAIAAASRPVGLAVCIGLVILVLERQGVLRSVRGAPHLHDEPHDDSNDDAPDSDDAGRGLVETDPSGRLLGERRTTGRFLDLSLLDPRGLVVLFSALGLIVWCGYLWARFGSPFAFSQTQASPGWDHSPGPGTWFKVRIFEIMNGTVEEPPGYFIGVVIQGMLAITFLASVPAVIRRFGWGYGAYVLLVVLVPTITSKDFQGLGRYVLVAFPVFAIAAIALVKRSGATTRFILAMSTALLLFFSGLYARGYFLA